MSRHIIHRQKVTVKVSRMEDAHLFQGRVSHMLRNELLNQIEVTLDKYFPTNQIIRIDSLQLDLGKLSKQNFEQEFRDGFIKALAEALSAQKNSENADSEVLSNAQSSVRALTHFLLKGNLPWYATTKKVAEWEKELLNTLPDDEYNHLANWLKDNHQLNPVIVQRLALQFSDELLEKLGSAILPVESWESVYKDFAYLFKTDRDNLWESIFNSLLSGQIDIKKPVRISELKTRTVKALIKEADQKTMGVISKELVNKSKELVNKSKELVKGKVHGKKQSGTDEYKEEDALYVNNCGVVLLHYFLRAYFEDLKLYEGEKFVSEKAHQRAVLLSNYLATGENGAAEFDLPLHKILCGYPLENTLPPSIKLTKREIEESDQLLKAVIDYWEPLRNTSIEGFRNTFLQREGKLVTKENGWLLTVEQKTVDILLGKLPWGFSTIRLPWMEQILNVDWY